LAALAERPASKMFSVVDRVTRIFLDFTPSYPKVPVLVGSGKEATPIYRWAGNLRPSAPTLIRTPTIAARYDIKRL
jgi:hypothetical protein